MELPRGFRVAGSSSGYGSEPRAVARVKEFLDKLKFGDLVTLAQISEALGYKGPSALSHVSASKYFSEYRHDITYNRIVWGSKRTIKELKKKLAR